MYSAGAGPRGCRRKVRSEAQKVGAGLLERGEKIAGQIIEGATEPIERAKEGGKDRQDDDNPGDEKF
jgi:hypothetical protein